MGAITAAVLLVLIARGAPGGYDPNLAGLGANGFGTHSPGYYTLQSAIIVEIVLTAFLVFTVTDSTDVPASVGFAGIPIGLVLMLIHLVGIPITNTSVNPARSLGPAMFVGGWAVEQLWVFVTSPLLGACIAAGVYLFIGRSGPVADRQQHPYIPLPTPAERRSKDIPSSTQLADGTFTVNSERPILPAHIEDTVRSIAELHADHDRRASLYQRTIERLIEQLGRPAAVAAIALGMLLWVGVNESLLYTRRTPFDPEPFSYLQGLITAGALFMTVLILTSQRHENRLAEHRAQLTLELAMVSEQKIAKLIELMESQRRDNPQIVNRIDEETAAMALPADPEAIFAAIQETHSDMIAEDNTTTA